MKRFILFLCSCCILIMVTACFSYAGYSDGDVFVWNDAGDSSDIIQYSSSGSFIKSFKSLLAPGTYISNGGHLRWGADKLLHSYGNYGVTDIDNNINWKTGTFVWNTDGTLKSFYERENPFNDTRGFTTAPNGNVYTVDAGYYYDSNGNLTTNGDEAVAYETVKEWVLDDVTGKMVKVDDKFRVEASGWDISNAGDEGAFQYGNNLYVTCAGLVTIYDAVNGGVPTIFNTDMDNDKLSISTDGFLVVNNQWDDETGQNIFLQGFDVSGNSLLSGGVTSLKILVNNGTIGTRGLSFDSQKGLYVVTMFDGDLNDSASAIIPQIQIYNRNIDPADGKIYGYEYSSYWTPLDADGNILSNPTDVAVASVPEPGSIISLVGLLGGLGLLRRKK